MTKNLVCYLLTQVSFKVIVSHSLASNHLVHHRHMYFFINFIKLTLLDGLRKLTLNRFKNFYQEIPYNSFVN
jgi:hypothetical protein